MAGHLSQNADLSQTFHSTIWTDKSIPDIIKEVLQDSGLAEADYAHTQFGLNAYRSAALLGGTCRYAEAFCILSLEQYRVMHRAYTGGE